MDEAMDLKACSDRISARMTSLGLNQSQLASRAGITQAALSKILAQLRSPSGEVLLKIADALNVSIDFLVGRTPDTQVEDAIRHARVQTLVTEYLQLSVQDQQRVLDLIRALKTTA